MPRLQIGSIDVSEDEVDWIKVATNLSSTSMRVQIGQMVQGHIVRFKPHYKRKVSYVARKYGLTWQEAFKRLTQEPPPFEGIEAVEEAPIREEEELSNFGCEVDKKETLQNDASSTTTAEE